MTTSTVEGFVGWRPRLVGLEQEVPLIDGTMRRYVNFDYAASTPPLEAVATAVGAMMSWYSSVHRGLGWKSQVSTAAYEGARRAVGAFFGCRAGDATIFTRSTTDSINMLARCLPEDTRVISSPVEHHANMLPWRQVHVDHIPIPSSPEDLLHHLELQLQKPAHRNTLVALGGASNVTGQIAPIREIVALAHRYNARTLIDAAQLAPHARIDMSDLDLDYLAMSGHKLYAPFGTGVLIGRPDWLAEAPPYLRGGGAVEYVGLDDVMWTGLPDRQEAGSPNVIGAVALGVACSTLMAAGMDRLAAEEAKLHAYARARLATVPGLQMYSLWPHYFPHVSVTTFNLDGYQYNKLAAILSAEYGVGVRGGCFCAHPYMLHLLHIGQEEKERILGDLQHADRRIVPGALRLSLGLGSTREEIDYLTDALTTIARKGPTWTYAPQLNGDYSPDPETRRWPDVPFPLFPGSPAVETDWIMSGGESS